MLIIKYNIDYEEWPNIPVRVSSAYNIKECNSRSCWLFGNADRIEVTPVGTCDLPALAASIGLAMIDAASVEGTKARIDAIWVHLAYQAYGTPSENIAPPASSSPRTR